MVRRVLTLGNFCFAKVLKGLFCHFLFLESVVDLKGLIWGIFTLGACGGLDMTDFGLLSDLALANDCQ